VSQHREPAQPVPQQAAQPAGAGAESDTIANRAAFSPPADVGASRTGVGLPPAQEPASTGLSRQEGTLDGYLRASGSPHRESLPEAWQRFLAQYPMQWFCTFTFQDQVHPERALKLFRLFIKRLNVTAYGRHYERKGQTGVYWVLAWEYQKRGVLHFHALIGDVEDLNAKARRFSMMRVWEGFGPPAGFARIETIESQEAVRKYVTKYIVKGGQIDLSTSLRSFAQQQALSTPAR